MSDKMQYIGKDDLLEVMAQRDLEQLLDVQDVTKQDTLLMELEAKAMVEIESYLRGRYFIPLETPLNEYVKIILTDAIVYRLYERRGLERMPKAIAEKRQETVSRLKEIQNRKVELDLKSIETISTNTKNDLLKIEEKRKAKFTGNFTNHF